MAASPRKLAATILDPIGNAVLMSRVGDLGLSHRHGTRTERFVALTFDDGPVAEGTEAALDALTEHQALATFFCVGVNVRQHPEIVRRAAAAGHVIGAHSMNHSRLTSIAPFGSAHIDDCLLAIHDAIGKTPALFRVPWGWMTPWELLRLRRKGLAAIRWDFETPDSLDPRPSGEQIAEWTLPHVRPGSILVFHDGAAHMDSYPKPETAQALRLMLPTLRARGYQFVTVPELLNIPAYQDEQVSVRVR
jgi:peptidoglycan/xylan/chitin deacetylase (PgdA/CDA1 family)